MFESGIKYTYIGGMVMNMDAYAFSKYLLVMFSRHQKHIEGWREFSNEYTSDVHGFSATYEEFKNKANNILISNDNNYKGREIEKSIAEKELDVMKNLKLEWKRYFAQYNKLGNNFIQKYADKIQNPDFEKDEAKLIEFLAEYNAFEKLQTHNYSIENFEILIDRQIQMFQKTLSQGQPGGN